jgi:hypothetical protein
MWLLLLVVVVIGADAVTAPRVWVVWVQVIGGSW